MVERYSLSPMKEVWTDQHKFECWLKVEIEACRAWAKLGKIPQEDLRQIEEKADFDVARILEIENEVHHDVIAFLTAVSEKIGPSSRFVHLGMTSSDVLDTALALQLKDAMAILIENAQILAKTLKEQAKKHRDTVQMGRSHGIHAEPITWGMKLALWYFEIKRGILRLEAARETISYGKISGAVGTYAHIDPQIEAMTCEALGLKPAEVSSQILQRDRHAEYLSAIALIGSSLDKIATEIRHLQRTEVLEVEEPFAKGQKGSSAMPHKKNPIICERVSGMARLLRANSVVGMENIALWHERDISHSSAERVVLPDSSLALHYMLVKMNQVISGASVYVERMRENIGSSYGLIYSQSVLLALVAKGHSREDAYHLVQRNAMKAWETRRDLAELLAEDSDISQHLSQQELKALTDPKNFLRNLDVIFNRLDD